MREFLKQHIIERVGREPENLDLVLNRFEETKEKRGHHLLREGEICKYVYFIVKGCLQVYVLDKRGNESTRSFYFENGWTTDIFGFQNQKPSSENIKCVEPCELLRVHYSDFQELSERLPQFMAIYKQLLEASYNNTVYRVNTLTAMDALERIQWLRENKPMVIKRLPSKLVASYLGISPETYTRLKPKL